MPSLNMLRTTQVIGINKFKQLVDDMHKVVKLRFNNNGKRVRERRDALTGI